MSEQSGQEAELARGWGGDEHPSSLTVSENLAGEMPGKATR